jgi:hypothetical protein
MTNEEYKRHFHLLGRELMETVEFREVLLRLAKLENPSISLSPPTAPAGNAAETGPESLSNQADGGPQVAGYYGDLIPIKSSLLLTPMSLGPESNSRIWESLRSKIADALSRGIAWTSISEAIQNLIDSPGSGESKPCAGGSSNDA